MKFALDADERFVVEAREFGWDLTVDGKIVHHCGTINDALRYMGDELRSESTADGLQDVIEALMKIDETIKSVSAVVAETITND